ncbi:MAG: Tol-Pal system beta propeller repeat protein TolB [Desulfobulbaceae bacterium]|nr:Tol-Pal system beta propeller repeat protein TolB [Desulfobulbaceae bacterium]
MKNLIFLLLAIMLPLRLTTTAEARIDVDISSAELRKVPVAVPYFIDSKEVGKAGELGQEMASILAEGLEFHGFISIIQASSYGGGQQSDWLGLGADFTVIGKYTNEGNDGMMMEIRLIDISTGRMILGRRYRGTVAKTRMMLLKFCDEIINKMTGEPGVSLTQIAFVSEKNGIKEIYLTDIFGNELRQITRHRKIAISPRFTADGLFISYTSYHRDNPNLYLTELAQSKITTPISRRKGLNMAPAWAPEGDRLVITLSMDGNPDLYLMGRDGEIISQLTKDEGINVSPSWSPDGSQLAFVSDRSGSPQIYVMNINTKSVRRITYVGNYNTTPAWSPKGDMIAYSGHHDGRYHIFVIPPEGGRPTRLTRLWGDHESPSWSPDGRQIAFSRNRDGEQKICAIFKNGAGLRVLFDWDGNESMPQWSPRPAM